MKKNDILKNVSANLIYYANKIHAPLSILPLINESNDFAKPFIEVDDSGLIYLIVRERGEEYERYITDTIDALLYWVFRDITFTMASKSELDNRVDNQDSRVIIYDEQIKLLNILNPQW